MPSEGKKDTIYDNRQNRSSGAYSMKIKNFEWKGIRIRNFNTLMILFSCVLYLILQMATTYTTQNYEQMVKLTDDHLRLEEAARTVTRASDYLTEQVRMYVQTQDENYAWRYFEEATITKNREKALAVMHQHSISATKDVDLMLAVNYSNELMTRELYAIALVAAAEGHADTTALPVLSGTILATADTILTPQEKIEKARDMVFDTEYQIAKNRIYEYLDSFTKGILSTTETRLGEGLDDLNSAISTQRILLNVLMILNAVTFLIITLLVVKPLYDCIPNVRERKLVRETGAYEFRYLAKTYNDIHQRSDALAASEAHLRSKVERDEITGLYNRPYFYRIAKEKIQSSTEEMYIITMDISNFKIVNEHYGMATGDRLLKDIGEQLQKLNENGNMIIARFVVDHYYICLPKSEFDRIELPKAFKSILVDMDIRVVYGVYLVEDKELPIHVMCDRALEAAHSKNKNFVDYVHIYNDSAHRQTLLEQEIEAEMEQALAERQFYIVVQPKYDPITEQIVGGETLVRWQHPKKGMISPGVFINIFERYGFIASLDYFVWEETCRLQAKLKQSGIKTVPISINISRIHFYNRGLRTILGDLIRKYSLDSSDIELEITESLCGEDASNIFDMIRELQSDGFRIAMDDFGSGYSSLNMLKEMPLDIIKMDLKFLDGEGSKSQVILKSLIKMAQTIGLSVVVEGVELLTQVDFLRQFENCYLQGYYFSRPVTTDVYESMLIQS